MGLHQADGTILINAPMDTTLQAGDHLFAISQDDDTVRPSGLTTFPI